MVDGGGGGGLAFVPWSSLNGLPVVTSHRPATYVPAPFRSSALQFVIPATDGSSVIHAGVS